MIEVIGGAYTSDPAKYQHLSATAAKFYIPLTILGRGKNHPGDAATIDADLLPALQASAYPYILLTDTYDTMFCRWDRDEVIDLIQAEPSGILYSCEGNCWPSGPWCEAYSGARGWRYINGGQVCGRREKLIDLWQEVKRYNMTGNCQERLHRMYADGYPIGLDRACKIFQSMSNPSLGIEWQDGGGVVNTHEETQPMMLHFNGRTPGIEYWYERVMGC